MKRRANREGSIFLRSDGRWCAYVTAPDGRRVYKYARTQRPLIDWLNTARGQAQQPLHADASRMTVAAYLARWLEVARRSLSPNTASQYALTINKHALPTIGELKLAKLRPDQLQVLYNTLLDNGVGNETVHVLHAVMSKAMRQAVRWGLLASSPAADLELPRRERHRAVQPLSLEQARQLLDAARGHPLEALIVLALNTGMRHGEMLGLKWSDIDWRGSTVHIQRQWTKYGYVMPKTQKSIRSIPLGADALAALRRHQERQQFARRDCAVLFPGRGDQPMSPVYVLRLFRRLLEAAGLPCIRLHDLRHTAASLMLAAGVHPKVVQERLGHANIAMTLDTYSHTIPSMQAAAAETLGDLLHRDSQ